MKLRDIGRAEDSVEEAVTSARLNGDPSVTLVVSKQSGTNTVATADAVKERLKELQLTLPKDIHIKLVNDTSHLHQGRRRRDSGPPDRRQHSGRGR